MKRLISLVFISALLAQISLCKATGSYINFFQHSSYENLSAESLALLSSVVRKSQFRDEFKENPMIVPNIPGENLWHDFKYVIFEAEKKYPEKFKINYDKMGLPLICNRDFLKFVIPDSSLSEEKQRSRFSIEEIAPFFKTKFVSQVRVKINVAGGLGPTMHLLGSALELKKTFPKKSIFLFERTIQGKKSNSEEQKEGTKPELFKTILTATETKEGVILKVQVVAGYRINQKTDSFINYVKNKAIEIGFSLALNYMVEEIDEIVANILNNIENYDLSKI